MTDLLSTQNLMMALKTHSVEFEESLAGNIWRVCVSLAQEDGVWRCIAAACTEAGSGAELRAVRYGPTVEQALCDCVSMLREAVEARQNRRNE